MRVMRSLLAALMIAALAFLISSPALADAKPLPLDMTVHGNPLPESGWISDREYRDDSIHIRIFSEKRKPKSSGKQITCRWVEVEIADPSQLRTTMSNESYDDHSLARATAMARSVDAAVALNGDFMKYTYDFGYVVRQGVFYRDALDGRRDILVVDDRGDFSVVPLATSADMAAHLQQLADDGREVWNTFSFGPAMIIDGEIFHTASGHSIEGNLATQRIAIAQIGPLQYAVIEIDGGNGTGMNIKEFSAYILQLYPDCRVAYNLDGGGSTHLIVDGRLIHKTANSRAISDIIYFASSIAEE